MYDGRVIPARTHLAKGMLFCERHLSESGQMRLLWPRFRRPSSGRAYHQSARTVGTVFAGTGTRTRSAVTAAQSIQFVVRRRIAVVTQLATMIQDSHRSFRTAVLRAESPETAVAAAILSIDTSSRATDLLCQHYVEQRLGYRRSRAAQLPVFLGCRLQSDSGRSGRVLPRLQCRADGHAMEEPGTRRR